MPCDQKHDGVKEMKGIFTVSILLFVALLPALLIGLFLRSKELLNSHEWKAQYRANRRVSDIKLSYLCMWLVVRLEVVLLMFILTFIFGGFNHAS